MYAMRIGMRAGLHILFILFVCIVSILCATCGLRTQSSEGAIIDTLFDIPIGLSQERLYYSARNNGQRFQHHYLTMRDGIITIASGLTNKILVFNSYGELIRSIYDPYRNPTSPFVQSADSATLVTRSAEIYDFNNIGPIATANNATIYVVDTVDDEQISVDEQLDIVRNNVILRFSSNHSQPIIIGEEGLGGSPFPPIKSLHIVNNDELVVVCDIDYRWLVFWYNNNGTPRFAIDIGPQSLPSLLNENDIIEIETVVPDYYRDRLYIKLNYYTYTHNSEQSEQNVAAQVISRVYWLELPSGIYEDFLEIPPIFNRQSDNTNYTAHTLHPITFELVNNAIEDLLFFVSHQSNNSIELLTMDLDGRVRLRHDIARAHEIIYFSHYYLSDDNIITALFGYSDRAEIEWWRLDRLFRS